MANDPILEFDRVSVTAGSRDVVREISFALPSGEIFGLLGANGAGKTTLLRTLYFAARPSAGEIRLAGRAQNAWTHRDWVRRLGVLVQGSGLLQGLTTADIVDIGLLPLGLSLAETQRRRGEALEIAGLTALAAQPADTLSGGELQRCYFAQLLARDPEIYVLDEPTNHLDLHYQLVLLDEARRRGRTILATFHDLTIAARYCHRVAVMEAGRLVAQGPVAEVITPERLRLSYRVKGQLIGSALHLDGPIRPPLTPG